MKITNEFYSSWFPELAKSDPVFIEYNTPYLFYDRNNLNKLEDVLSKFKETFHKGVSEFELILKLVPHFRVSNHTVLLAYLLKLDSPPDWMHKIPKETQDVILYRLTLSNLTKV